MPLQATTLPQDKPERSAPFLPRLDGIAPSASQPQENTTVLALAGKILMAMAKPWWMVLDVVIVTAGLILGYWLFRSADWGGWEQVRLWQATLVLCPTVIISGLLLGLYEQDTLANRSWIISRVLLTICISALISGAIITLVLYDAMSRRTALIALGFYACAGIGLRILAASLIRVFKPAILFIGQRPDSAYMQSLAHDPGMERYGAVHHLAFDQVSVEDERHVCQLKTACRAHDIREVVIHSSGFRNDHVLRAALGALRDGHRVTDEVTFYEKTLHRVPVNAISAEWFLFADLQIYREERASLKWLSDVFVATIGLIVSLPLLPIIALAIKLDSKGPIFYWQDRVGRNGRIFRLYKFRTMTVDAEGAGILWSTKGDRRVTRVGRFLRRTRLDELPQLWNILLGQMSMVGPRPERPQFVDQLHHLIPFYDQRHLIKPGLTGWAQTNYRYGNCVDDAMRKLEYDLYYLKHMSLELDLCILARTVLAVIQGGS